MLGTLFQQLYSFADTIIVGRCLGTDALGAVGTTYSLNFLILGFIQGACVGFGIPAAESFGAKDHKNLERFLINGATLCIGLSAVFTVVTTLTAPPLLKLIHTPPELFDDASLYIRIISWEFLLRFCTTTPPASCGPWEIPDIPFISFWPPVS